MKIKFNEDKIFRVVDANINRLKEGIRVIEDINRYIFDDKNIASELKKIRHKIALSDEVYSKLLNSRNSKNDVLKFTLKEENKRDSIFDVLKANYRRAMESARVLEELNKIIKLDPEKNMSEHFKSIRYDLYSIEKDNFQELQKSKENKS
jgi:thiamine-phosphate pyrophosphorylase